MLCDLSEDCWSKPRTKLVLQIRTSGFDFQWGYYYFLLRQTKINSVYISSDDYFDGCFLFVSEESSSDVNVSSPAGNIETNRICFAPCLQFKVSNARMTTNAKYGQKQLCRKRTWFLYSFLLSFKWCPFSFVSEAGFIFYVSVFFSCYCSVYFCESPIYFIFFSYIFARKFHAILLLSLIHSDISEWFFLNTCFSFFYFPPLSVTLFTSYPLSRHLSLSISHCLSLVLTTFPFF